MKLVRVTAPHFVAGYESDGLWVRRAAPILRYVLDWPEFQAWNYFDRKGWKYEIVA